jgi:2-amino-4-hydroxy-6-hydroxymethyldihydropteridine diphosphokinase
MNSQVTAYLGLGSNLGDRAGHLREAVGLLAETDGIAVTAVSSVYETAPVGYVEQPDFLNMVIRVETSLSPEELLDAAMRVERLLHRVRGIRWGPRTIDIDILIYGDAVIRRGDLSIPHPRMADRAFVLVPLREIAGNLLVPGTDARLDDWIRELPADQEIHQLDLSVSD